MVVEPLRVEKQPWEEAVRRGGDRRAKVNPGQHLPSRETENEDLGREVRKNLGRNVKRCREW